MTQQEIEDLTLFIGTGLKTYQELHPRFPDNLLRSAMSTSACANPPLTYAPTTDENNARIRRGAFRNEDIFKLTDAGLDILREAEAAGRKESREQESLEIARRSDRRAERAEWLSCASFALSFLSLAAAIYAVLR